MGDPVHGPEGPKLPAEARHMSVWLWDAMQVTVPEKMGSKSLGDCGDCGVSVFPPVPHASLGHICDPHSSLGTTGGCVHFHSENVAVQRGPARFLRLRLVPVALDVEPGVVWL